MKTKKEQKILIAGIGNLLFSDEGIGVHVIRELHQKALPSNVELIDLGTSTFDLVGLMEGKDKVILVDAIASEEPVGTIFKLTPEDLKSGKKKLLTSLHQLGVMETLEFASRTGSISEMVIFGITPKDYQSLGMELTPELKSALPRIVEVILKEIE
jgi:hydrogenase maturation protease